MIHEIDDILPAVSLFRSVHDVVRLDQNLIVGPVNVFQCVVMPHQEGHPVDLTGR